MSLADAAAADEALRRLDRAPARPRPARLPGVIRRRMEETIVAPAALPLDRAAYRYWMIRHLLREHAMDLGAADTALAPLRDHPHPRVAWLAAETTREIVARFNALPRSA